MLAKYLKLTTATKNANNALINLTTIRTKIHPIPQKVTIDATLIFESIIKNFNFV